jgi:hypothetical protein
LAQSDVFYYKKVYEVVAPPVGVEVNVETAEPEDGKSGSKEGLDENSGGSKEDDGDKDSTSGDIDTEIENID